MKQFYLLFQLTLLFTVALISQSAFAQPVCGVVVQDFNNTGGTMAGFTSSTLLGTSPGFTFGQNGTNGYLQRCGIPTPGATYEIISPTYQSFNNQTYVGYGFQLSGDVQVSDINVFVEFIGNDNQINTVQDLTVPAVTYSGGVASICDSFLLAQAIGFSPGESYRFVFEITSASASADNQCIILDNYSTTGGPAAAPLPVSFIGFGAKKTAKGVELIWNVAGERDVQTYVVERSTTGSNFARLGEVAASNSTAYSFIDDQPANGQAFYRIKEVDIDGKSKNSPIVRLNFDNSLTLRAYPSPAKDEVTIEHAITGKGTITITTSDGRVVKQVSVKPELYQTVINVSTLNAGLYIIRFVNEEGKTETTKLIKQ